ncbi:MAG: methylated-DNA--[protein]-cysteine S-methyltransferase, partial [Candidatus Eremiobacteraeota bacterium]|nr:methylated-DNA--[protein]-cysteine S-methyltransferase [Candidatus Eremiobacteraeota bacterium]
MSGAPAAVATAIVATPFGRRLYVACDDEHVVASEFTPRRALVPRAVEHAGPHRLLQEAVAQIEAYCGKRLRRFDLPLFLAGTPLQIEIWRAVASLEFGTLCSYGDVARAV